MTCSDRDALFIVTRNATLLLHSNIYNVIIQMRVRIMKGTINKLATYLHETLGITVKPGPWAKRERLPLFLKERYDFYEVRLYKRRCLLIVDRNESQQPPTTIRKHIEQVCKRWDSSAIYVRQSVTAYNRKRLIQQKVSFIVPGNQMYLPHLGIDLREYFIKQKSDRHQFRPATQVVLFEMLLNDRNARMAELAIRLGYSAMTISRAFDELQSAGIAESRVAGRERHISLAGESRAVWQKARPYLIDPVQNRHWVTIGGRRKLPGPYAGLSALSRYSMLAEPDYSVIALSRSQWRQVQQHDAPVEAIAGEPDALQIEVWVYPPSLFAAADLVDPLSLYQTMGQEHNERVEAALEEMMEQLQW